ncbi:class I SAM-dependent methyltransferase [Nocardioides panacisoli]
MSGTEWSQVAEAWERNADAIEETSSVAGDALLAAAALAPGERVLELGAGTGHLAVRLAELVGPDGQVVATDVAPAMVERIEQRVAAVRNASAAVVDAAAIPDEIGSFDVVICRMGLMFVPDPAVALQEVRRVLRPGGRLAVAVWGDMGRNPWLVAVGFAAMMNGLVSGPPPNQPGGPFSLGDADQLEKLARDAGFDDVRVDVVEYVRHYASADEQFDMVRVLAPPIAAALEAATPEQVDAVRRGAAEYVAQYRTEDGGLDLPACALVLTAR